MESDAYLVSKYNIPGPRYTSYPTVPYWDGDSFSFDRWQTSIKEGLRLPENDSNQGISLYIHLPFCESLCTFCGCTKRITKNHLVEKPYIKALLKELSFYVDILGHRPRIQQLHLGGGTPTFFSAENLGKNNKKKEKSRPGGPRSPDGAWALSFY